MGVGRPTDRAGDGRNETANRSGGPSRGLTVAIAAGIGSIGLLALAFGSPATKVFGLVVALAGLQGLWLGATRVAGVLAGLLLAAWLAPGLGVLIEDPLGAATARGGLAARALGIALAALAIVAITAGVGGLAARKLRRGEGAWRRWDRPAGAALGLAEGAVLATLLAWAPLALEPVARAQTDAASPHREARPGERPRSGSGAARLVLSAAEGVRDSALGPVAEATNPIAGLAIFRLAEDFMVVSRSEAAMDHFLNSEAMQRAAGSEGLDEAMRILRADEDLARRLETEGVSIPLLLSLLESETILRILDETTLVRDLAPLTDALAEALREARAAAEPPPEPPSTPLTPPIP